MISNELINKIENIQELSISEETLGAYIEGNLINNDLTDVQNIINNDSLVGSIIYDVKQTTTLLDNVSLELIDSFNITNFELPSIEEVTCYESDNLINNAWNINNNNETFNNVCDSSEITDTTSRSNFDEFNISSSDSFFESIQSDDTIIN